MHTQIHTDHTEGHAVFMYKRNASVLPPPRYVFTQFLFVYAVCLCVLDLATCVHVSYEHMCINSVSPPGWFFFSLFLLEGGHLSAHVYSDRQGQTHFNLRKTNANRKKNENIKKTCSSICTTCTAFRKCAATIHNTNNRYMNMLPKTLPWRKACLYGNNAKSISNANNKCIIIIV